MANERGQYGPPRVPTATPSRIKPWHVAAGFAVLVGGYWFIDSTVKYRDRARRGTTMPRSALQLHER